MSHIFSGCSALTSLDLRKFNTAWVTSPSGFYDIFNLCSKLQQLTLGQNFRTLPSTSTNLPNPTANNTVTIDGKEYKTTGKWINVGDKLSQSTLSGGEVHGVDTTTRSFENVSGSFAWKNPSDEFTGTGQYKVVFTPDTASSKNYTVVEFDVNVEKQNSPSDPGTPSNPNNPNNPNGPSDPSYPTKSNVVILASGEKYTDVLTATVLAHEKNCPILLTKKDVIDDKTINEIKRLDASEIIISGGENSVSAKVVSQLKDYNVRRISGVDRYETAEKIGKEVRTLSGKLDETVLVDGTNFPDVISISTLASQKRVPILITKPDKLVDSTKQALKDWSINSTIIGGSYNSVSKDVEKSLGVSSVKRIGGSDRYATAELVGTELRKLTENNSNMILVNGTDFPDGITISSIASKTKAPIMLTNPNKLPKITGDKISEWKINYILIGGGYNSVSKDIEDKLQVSNKERIAGQNRYETAVKISQKLSQIK
ncbi:MAG: cell wall-binding repeat-containing protein [Clostridioides sp.]|jgi:cell wall-associated protease|nr:cell wall-binding repeat-containing protein [Clostridioides sp.]